MYDTILNLLKKTKLFSEGARKIFLWPYFQNFSIIKIHSKMTTFPYFVIAIRFWNCFFWFIDSFLWICETLSFKNPNTFFAIALYANVLQSVKNAWLSLQYQEFISYGLTFPSYIYRTGTFHSPLLTESAHSVLLKYWGAKALGCLSILVLKH